MDSSSVKMLSIGEVSARSGVAISAIHFYERKGLIGSWRTAGNQRRYPSGTLRRLGIIQFGQSLGISLAEIGDALRALPDDRLPSAEDWRGLAEAWAGRLDKRIEGLQRLRDRLTDCIGCGCLSTEKCPLRNPDDRLAAGGKGPRRLVEF